MMVTLPIYGVPVERSGFHSFCAHVKNDADTAIYAIVAATCPWLAAYRACVLYRRWRRKLNRREYGDHTLFACMIGGA